MKHLAGSWVAVPTPFTENDDVDFGAFERLIDFQASNGSCALLVMGSCGEATMLSGEERREIIRRVAAMARDQIPAFFGTTASTTKETVELTKLAEDHGAAGVVLVVPPYITPPQDAVLEHFVTVAQSVALPVALYNNPTRVKVNIEPATIARVHQLAPNCWIDKEATNETSQIAEVVTQTNGSVSIFPCDFPGYGLIPVSLALGGSGIATVTGNVAPGEMAALAVPWTKELDIAAWREDYLRLLPLMKAMYWLTNPVVIKAAVRLLGIDCGHVRKPLPELRGSKLAELDDLLTALGLKARYAKWATPPVQILT